MTTKRKYTRTLTQTQPHTFAEALAKLEAGECVGIKPQNNSGYIVRHAPKWSRNLGHTDPNFLCWQSHTDERDGFIRIEQYLGEWFLVVIDARDLPFGENGQVKLVYDQPE